MKIGGVHEERPEKVPGEKEPVGSPSFKLQSKQSKRKFETDSSVSLTAAGLDSDKIAAIEKLRAIDDEMFNNLGKDTFDFAAYKAKLENEIIPVLLKPQSRSLDADIKAIVDKALDQIYKALNVTGDKNFNARDNMYQYIHDAGTLLRRAQSLTENPKVSFDPIKDLKDWLQECKDGNWLTKKDANWSIAIAHLSQKKATLYAYICTTNYLKTSDEYKNLLKAYQQLDSALSLYESTDKTNASSLDSTKRQQIIDLVNAALSLIPK